MAKSKTTSTINALLKLAAIPVQLGAADEAADAGQVSALVFETGGETFAIDVQNIEGVVDCPKITPLPTPPEGVIGVTSVRGRMTLVVCLTANRIAADSRRRLILLRGEAQLGLFADRIEDVVSFSEKEARGDRRQRRAVITHKKRKIQVVDIEQLVES